MARNKTATSAADTSAEVSEKKDSAVEPAVVPEEEVAGSEETETSEATTDEASEEEDNTVEPAVVPEEEVAGGEGAETSEVATNEVSEKAAKIFSDYPQADEVYFTSDGLAFLEECNAQNHAAGLEDKEVEKITKQSE